MNPGSGPPSRTDPRPWRLILILVAALTLAGCGRGFEAGGLGVVEGAETPRPAAGTVAQGAIHGLRDALAIGGYELAPATRTFQPAQPASFMTVPRSAYQVRLSDPDGGVVLIYELADPEAARVEAQAMADYLSSGPGKINYPGDASFYVGLLGSSVIMSWFSASQSADPEAARGAFDLITTVGTEIPVLR